MEVSTVRILRIVLLFGALAAALLGKLFLKISLVLGGICMVLALAAIIAEIIISFFFWKCPWCERRLHPKLLFPKHCSHCGGPL